MLLEHEGLNEATVGELRKATSTFQEGDLARQRVKGPDYSGVKSTKTSIQMSGFRKR